MPHVETERPFLPAAESLVALIGHLHADRARRAITTYAATAAALAIGKHLAEGVRNRFAYTVTIDGTDDLYVPVQAELYRILPDRSRRALSIRSVRKHGHGHLSRDDRPLDVASLFDSTHEHRFRHHGQTVKVRVEKEAGTVVISDNYRPAQKLMFTAMGVQGRDAVVDFVSEVAARVGTDRTPRIYMASRWNEWLQREQLTVRPLGSVFLPDDQKARIVRDMTGFLDDRDRYAQLGLPYHRGYLFHGRPRTGKTSFARALASHFGLDVYYLPLSSIENDAGLFQLLGQITPHSMLIIEDADVAHGTTDRTDDQGVTTAGLLNGLDGLVTPDGLITVMTTNHRELLDPALIDLGRIDRDEEFGYLDGPLARHMISTFTDDHEAQWYPADGAQVQPAALAEAIKRGFAGEAALEDAIVELTPLRRALPTTHVTRVTDDGVGTDVLHGRGFSRTS